MSTQAETLIQKIPPGDLAQASMPWLSSAKSAMLYVSTPAGSLPYPYALEKGYLATKQTFSNDEKTRIFKAGEKWKADLEDDTVEKRFKIMLMHTPSPSDPKGSVWIYFRDLTYKVRQSRQFNPEDASPYVLTEDENELLTACLSKKVDPSNVKKVHHMIPFHPLVVYAWMLMGAPQGFVNTAPSGGLRVKSSAGITMNAHETMFDIDYYHEFLCAKMAFVLQYVQGLSTLSTIHNIHTQKGMAQTIKEEYYAHTLNATSGEIRDTLPRGDYESYRRGMVEKMRAFPTQLKRADLILKVMMPVGEVRFLEIAFLKRLNQDEPLDDVSDAKQHFREKITSKNRYKYFPFMHVGNDLQKDSLLNMALDEVDLLASLIFGFAADVVPAKKSDEEHRAIHLFKGVLCMVSQKDAGWEDNMMDTLRVTREYIYQAIVEVPEPQFFVANRRQALSREYANRVTSEASMYAPVGNLGRPRETDSHAPSRLVWRKRGHFYEYGQREDDEVRVFYVSMISPDRVLDGVEGRLKEDACTHPGLVCNAELGEACHAWNTTGCHSRYIKDSRTWAVWFVLLVWQLAREEMGERVDDDSDFATLDFVETLYHLPNDVGK